jgi:hypothetical protein
VPHHTCPRPPRQALYLENRQLTGERSSLRGGKTDGEGGDGVAAVVDGRGWVLFDWVEKLLLMRCAQGIEERASDDDEFLVG